jgi:oxygen-independent coproporphyrinogen-3 oxidase
MAGVYLSFPFCAQKCTFCNFASGVFPRELERAYVAALAGEIRRHEWRWTPETLYIGGGTPSRIAPAELRSILEAIPGRAWREGTIEAAPGSLTEDNVRAWVDAGLNRVSLGVQSFNARELARTGRRHTVEIVKADCALLRRSGIENFNIDLICGLPWQTQESWRESLDWVERLAPRHVSVYMFEIDEDSRLGLEILNSGERYGAGAVPSEDLTVAWYEDAVDRLASFGLERYEISNFARKGFESLHNLKYWLLEPYAGFGADAHSCDGGVRWNNVEAAEEYVARSRDGRPLQIYQAPANTQEERFFVGLRLMQGVAPEAPDWERYGSAIERLVDEGLLSLDGAVLKLTRRGVLLSNEVFQEFISS